MYLKHSVNSLNIYFRKAKNKAGLHQTKKKPLTKLEGNVWNRNLQTTHLIRAEYTKYVKNILFCPHWSSHIPAAFPAVSSQLFLPEHGSSRKQSPYIAPTPTPAPIKLLSLHPLDQRALPNTSLFQDIGEHLQHAGWFTPGSLNRLRPGMESAPWPKPWRPGRSHPLVKSRACTQYTSLSTSTRPQPTVAPVTSVTWDGLSPTPTLKLLCQEIWKHDPSKSTSPLFLQGRTDQWYGIWADSWVKGKDPAHSEKTIFQRGE